ncbi:MAG TPA: aldo/keto reductase, partial [Tepidisphaeraceae bacterium]|nr:aldo/keto reductase [Tepidisphaeraceae bacterium]
GDARDVPEKHPRREKMIELVALMDKIARQHNVPRSVIALAWLLKHPAGIIPIVGTTRPEVIRASVQADARFTRNAQKLSQPSGVEGVVNTDPTGGRLDPMWDGVICGSKISNAGIGR